MVVKKTEQRDSKVKAMEKEPKPMIAQEKTVEDKAKAVSQRSTSHLNPTSRREVQRGSTLPLEGVLVGASQHPATDSLDYYIDKIERELAQVDESLYIERMNKVIRADERLQRMVNSYILHTLDKEGRPQTAENMYNVKTEEDEE